MPRGTCFATHTDYQVNYINYYTGWLIPNTEVWVGDERLMKINSLGCKGEELDPRLGTIGFFDDSTTFGASNNRVPDSWPFHVRIPGYQALNAGVEGHPFDRLCARYDGLSTQVDFAAAVIAGTWHNIVYNKVGEQAWAGYFARFSTARVLAICTLPTAFNPESSRRGIDELVCATGPNAFHHWGNWPGSAAKSRQAYDAVLRYNAFVRKYCRESGAVLIDLFYAYRPESYANMPDMFTDPIHARADLYPALGLYAADRLARVLPSRADVPIVALEAPQMAAHHDVSPDSLALDHRVYPLW